MSCLKKTLLKSVIAPLCFQLNSRRMQQEWFLKPVYW